MTIFFSRYHYEYRTASTVIRTYIREALDGYRQQLRERVKLLERKRFSFDVPSAKRSRYQPLPVGTALVPIGDRSIGEPEDALSNAVTFATCDRSAAIRRVRAAIL